jgi:hypothetical protein
VKESPRAWSVHFGWLSRPRPLAHPGSEFAHPGGLVSRQLEVKEGFQVFDPQLRQVQAEFAFDMLSAGAQRIHGQALLAPPPDFGHAECRIDTQAADDATADFRFNDQIRRGINRKIDMAATANSMVIENVKASIRLKPLGQVRTFPGRRSQAALRDT